MKISNSTLSKIAKYLHLLIKEIKLNYQIITSLTNLQYRSLNLWTTIINYTKPVPSPTSQYLKLRSLRSFQNSQSHVPKFFARNTVEEFAKVESQRVVEVSVGVLNY